jgi:hypothetical protein
VVNNQRLTYQRTQWIPNQVFSENKGKIPRKDCQMAKNAEGRLGSILIGKVECSLAVTRMFVLSENLDDYCQDECDSTLRV